MHNPLFYEWQRMRASTFNIPRFLHSYDETLDGGLILPRGMLPTVTVTDLAAQAGSRLDIIDERTPGTAQQFTLTATLKPPQRAAATELARSRPACTPGKGSTALRWTPYFLAAPEGRLVQYAGRILRPYDGKATAEVHDYHDELTGVLASSLAKRAPGYTSLGFPDPASPTRDGPDLVACRRTPTRYYRICYSH